MRFMCIFFGPHLLALVCAVPGVIYVACMLRVCCVFRHGWKILKSDCNTLQHTATHCDTLQYTATHCITLHHTATHCNTLQHTATHCITLHHTATHCNTLQHTTTQNLYLHPLATVRVVPCVVWVPSLMRVALCHSCVWSHVSCVWSHL